MSAAAGVNSGKAFDIINMSLDCDDYVLKYKLNQTQKNVGTINAAESPYYGFEKHGLGYLTFIVDNIDPYLETILKEKINYKLVTLPNEIRVIMLHAPDVTLLEILGK